VAIAPRSAPAAPPIAASSSDSVRNWVETCRRAGPRAATQADLRAALKHGDDHHEVFALVDEPTGDTTSFLLAGDEDDPGGGECDPPACTAEGSSPKATPTTAGTTGAVAATGATMLIAPAASPR
jgi:hypothetical protein